MMQSVSQAYSFEDDDDKPPFQVIIDKNLRSRQKRIQDETQEELTKVLERVENVAFYFIFLKL